MCTINQVNIVWECLTSFTVSGSIILSINLPGVSSTGIAGNKQTIVGSIYTGSWVSPKSGIQLFKFTHLQWATKLSLSLAQLSTSSFSNKLHLRFGVSLRKFWKALWIYFEMSNFQAFYSIPVVPFNTNKANLPPLNKKNIRYCFYWVKMVLQGINVVLLKVIFFREGVKIASRKNNWCLFFNQTDPFWGF